MKQILVISIALIIGLYSCTDCNTKNENLENKTYMNLVGSELKIIAEVQLKTDAIEAMKPIFEKVIAASQAEDGCIYYDLHQEVSDTTNTKYVMVEIWKDQAAIDTHNQTQHFKTFIQASADYIENMKVSVLKISK